jgi:hypothetical protein
MSATGPESGQPVGPPRSVALSGVIFSVLYIVSLVLIRSSVPADPAEPGEWLADPTHRDWVRLALNLVPFAGIAFLWFVAVLRNRVGLLEDRFFSTVFLGSGLLFVATLFAATAVAQGLQTVGPGEFPGRSETYRMARGTGHALMTFSMKMAAVFMFVTSTIGLRMGILSRWISLLGFAFGLVLLLTIAGFAWIALLFPCWVLLVSTWVLITEFRRGRPRSTREDVFARSLTS